MSAIFVYIDTGCFFDGIKKQEAPATCVVSVSSTKKGS